MHEGADRKKYIIDVKKRENSWGKPPPDWNGTADRGEKNYTPLTGEDR